MTHILTEMHGTRMSFVEFCGRHATPEACLQALEAVRWEEGAYCPNCGGVDRIYRFSDGRRHKCGDCKRVFRLITGTIFADSPIKMLPKWFAAMYLDATSPKGLSSLSLAKMIGVRQSTAWYMLQRIRHAAGNAGTNPMAGVVECDETYLGGKERNKHANKRLRAGRGTAGKQPVVGMRERATGRVIAKPVEGTSRGDLLPILQDALNADAEIHTDEHAAYNHMPFERESVRHGNGEYVRGNVHINGIESFWASVKRCYMGVHHWWSWKHSARYIDMCSFRQNNRLEYHVERVERLIRQGVGVRIFYNSLTRGEIQ